MMRSKRPFSLLELALVMLLVSLFTVLFQMPIRTHETFAKEADTLFNLISLGKRIALLSRTDIEIKLTQKKEDIEALLLQEGKLLTKKKIKGLYFLFNDRRFNNLDLYFFSTGFSSPKGQLDVSDNKKKKSYSL